MRIVDQRAVYLVSMAVSLAGCSQPSTTGTTSPQAPVIHVQKTTRIEAGPDAAKQAQTALIKAKPGEIIEFGQGDSTSRARCRWTSAG